MSSINEAFYISEAERAIERIIVAGMIPLHRYNTFLKDLDFLANRFAQELENDINKREGQFVWLGQSMEFKLLALATILAGWSNWVFTAKSEDPKFSEDRRLRAQKARPYVRKVVEEALRIGELIGKEGKRPEGKTELINLG